MREEIEGHEPRLAYQVRDFCRSIGIGKSKFYDLVARGKIRTVIVGGRRLVPAKEAQRVVSEGVE
jgi:excisionase family DNA binding protein